MYQFWLKNNLFCVFSGNFRLSRMIPTLPLFMPFEFPATVYHNMSYLSHCLRHMSHSVYILWIQRSLSTCSISLPCMPFCQDCCGSHKVSLVGLHYEPSTGLACRLWASHDVSWSRLRWENCFQSDHIISPGMQRLIDWLIDWLIGWLIDWLTDWLMNIFWYFLHWCG